MISAKNNRCKTFALLALACFSQFFVGFTSARAVRPAIAAQLKNKIIKEIIVSGNKMIPPSAILSRIPYRVGEKFDPRKTRTLIHNLYNDLKRFRNIWVKAQEVGENEVILHIIVEEKIKVKKFMFDGNKKLSEKDIDKKLEFDNIPSIDKEELDLYAKQIKKLYTEKSYHDTKVTADLEIDDDGLGIATFYIKEGKKSTVKRVRFIGNENISSKELRGLLFTREDWLLSFVDGAGKYNPERIEADRHIIEQNYQNRGYMMAKVIDVDVKQNPKTKSYDVTFEIEEGDLFHFGDVETSGNDILKDEYLVERLPVQKGQKYSREKIMDSIKALEGLWGELGYVYANIDPSIRPDKDTKTVDVSFEADLGNKIFLNKINIFGNKKTHDKVIRRKILLSEGQMLTEGLMEASKYRIESLGFFDQKDGVIWRKIRIDENLADLDLVLKETKTGNANFKMGFGGSVSDMQSSVGGFSIGGEISDSNLFGTGIQTRLNASWAKEEQSILFNITDPWLFDIPLMGALDVYHRRPHYDDFRHSRAVVEKLTGGGATLGLISKKLLETQFIFRLGADRVLYESPPVAQNFYCPNPVEARIEYQSVLDKLFEPGKFFWSELHMGMDKKNHPMHTSRGYKWLAVYRVGVPTFGCNIGFHKFDIEANWYTPLIGERDLVLHLRGYAGIASRFKGRTIPYRELFHIGGPATVRGFLFGQAGPQFLGDSIGGNKGAFVNVELLFPITPDFNMKGVFFYDAGAGWDNPYACEISKEYLQHNKFNFRHSVGAGFRVYNPMPIRIDWGFKLNRDKKLDEPAGEVHFGMSYDF